MNSTPIQNPYSKYFRSGMLTAAAALLGLASSANAGLIAYESFNYPQQTGLASSANTGLGWTTTWNSDSWRTNYSGYGEISTGLSYSTLPVAGQAARNENNGNQTFRVLTPQAATGTYWISFLMQKDDASVNSFGISLFNGGSEQNFMGNANSDQFSVAGAGAFVSSTPVSVGTASFFVARYNMDTGTAHFWINPDLSGTPSDASALNGSGGTSFTAFAFDGIRLGKFGADDSGKGYLDEIRIGTTFADMSAVPEPPAPVLIAYEGFDYPQATPLSLSDNTGDGWTTTWDSGSWRTNSSGFDEISPGLSYSTLDVVGEAARNDNDGNQCFRQFEPQAASGTYWITFLMQKDDSSVNSFGISLFNGATEQNFMGNASSDQFSVAGAGAFVSSTPVSVGTASFFVARYNMDTGTAHFWIDPDLSGTPSDASALNGPGGTSFTAFAFDGIRLGKFNAGSGYLDEIRIGTGYAVVAPGSGSPSTELAIFRSSNGLASDGSQDLLTPANDGVTNLMKYACNMIGAGAGQVATLSIPNVAGFNGTAGLPLVGLESGTGKLTLTYLRRKASGSPAPGITYSVQFGSTLADFAVNGAATEVSTSIDATFESVVVTDSALPPGKRFARLQVTAP